MAVCVINVSPLPLEGNQNTRDGGVQKNKQKIPLNPALGGGGDGYKPPKAHPENVTKMTRFIVKSKSKDSKNGKG